MKFYHYPKCSTCRNAQKWLEKHGKDLEPVDITLDPPAASQLKEILRLSGKGFQSLLNTSGVEYRALNMKDKVQTLPQDKILEMMSKNGRLIKRPLLTDGKKATIGFKEEEFRKTWG